MQSLNVLDRLIEFRSFHRPSSQVRKIGRTERIAGCNLSRDTSQDVPTDLFVAWGRQAEMRYPLSEMEIVKYFDSKCKEILLQLESNETPSGACDPAMDGAEPEEKVTGATDVSGPKRHENEHAGAFRMLLPSRLNVDISTEVLEILQSAHRLHRTDAPMKVALRSGWLDPRKLPSTVLCQKDLDEMARRLCWKNVPGLVHIPGSPHRAHFGQSASRLCSVTVHVGRYLEGLWDKAQDLDGSTVFVGPAGCGKTTILRDAAVNMSKELQVQVVDLLGDFSDLVGNADLGCLTGTMGTGGVERIRQTIDEHVPEVIIAEFRDKYSALKAGFICREAGVRLVCSVRTNLQSLVDSFVHVYSGRPEARDVACLTFPFASVVLLSRQSEDWEIYRDAPAVICSRGRSRFPRCELHHSSDSAESAGCSVAEFEENQETGSACVAAENHVSDLPADKANDVLV
ncbi:unnamed protein product [Cladocopium goreaui]|uniref:RNase H type-1 domain-containing protein n=1 Tax=Cladocopium goreaui TaxID=2562237 RepID=A0A9P1DK67_9DINO|nr:unnamed protein product [Cladocopium goreaui]CAI4011960.1 unnamed protein product [Cladocopium goreaui]